jgi:hypothetical protein
VSDFAQTAAIQADIVLPRGSLGSRLGFCWRRASARIPLHSPRIRLFLSHPKLSSQATSGAGLSSQLAATVTDPDEASIAETTPATSLTPLFAAVVPRLPIVAGAQTTADKPSYAGDTRTEGNCVSVKLRRPRMVWAANDRPAIAAVALGRTAPATGSIDAALLAARTDSQGDPGRRGDAEVAAASSTEPQSAVATPKNKKAQKSARSQNHRRDQYRYGAPSWREGRVDDWAARGYAPRERDYRRGAYGRGGVTPNFC